MNDFGYSQAQEDYDRQDVKPEYGEKNRVGTCNCCGAPIYEGDDVYVIGDSMYCTDCVIHTIAQPDFQ